MNTIVSISHAELNTLVNNYLREKHSLNRISRPNKSNNGWTYSCPEYTMVIDKEEYKVDNLYATVECQADIR